MIKALFFGVDVLVDCDKLQYELFTRALRLTTGKNIGEYEFATFFSGLNTAEKLTRLINEKRITKDQAFLVGEKELEIFADYAPMYIEPESNLIDLIDALKKEYSLFCVAHLDPHFSFLWLESAGIEMAGELTYENAIDVAHVAVDECLAIEHNKHGVERAKAAGVTVGVLSHNQLTIENVRKLIQGAEQGMGPELLI